MVKNLILMTILLALTACGGRSNGPKTKEAVLLDSAVSGVKYDNGDGIFHFTDKNGVFKYIDGKEVKFWVGKVYLGKAKPTDKAANTKAVRDKIVTPFELADVKNRDFNNEKVLKIASFLMGVDKDGNAANGIEVDLSKLKDKEKSYNVSNTVLDILLKDTTLYQKNEVKEHLIGSLGLQDGNNLENDKNRNTNAQNYPENNQTTENNSTSQQNDNSQNGNDQNYQENNETAQNNTNAQNYPENNQTTENNSTSQQNDNSQNGNEESSEANITIPPNSVFIAPNGDNKTGDGSFEKPYADIRAVCRDANEPHGGLIVFYRGGTYTNEDFGNGGKNNPSMPQIRCSGVEGNPVIIKPWANEKVKFKSDATIAVRLTGNYVKLENVEIEGIAQDISYQDAVANWWRGDRYYNGSGIVIDGHHVEVSNTIVHDIPASGISAKGGDFVTIKDNIVYNCDWWTIAGSKGIGVTDAASSDGSTTAQNIKIENNLIFNVESRIMSRVWGKGFAHLTIDEGEGILVQINRGNYTGRYLVKNNFLLFVGKGIVINTTDKTDLVSNTLYQSGTTIAGNFKGLRGVNTHNSTISNNAVTVVPDGYAYNMGGSSSDFNISNNCLDGNESLNIAGLHYTSNVFVNPDALDFRTTTECNNAGASQEVWQRLKAKADEYGIEIKPTNWKADYVDVTREIVNHIPDGATVDWSSWNDSQPFELNITNIPDEGINGRPSSFILKVEHPYVR